MTQPQLTESPQPPPEADAPAPVTLGEHLGSIIEGRLRKLTRSLEAAYAERSVDAVHDLRVVSRRLRAFGVAFQDVLEEQSLERLRRSLRRVARAVGSLRDQDVQIALIAARAEHPSSDLERAGADYLLEQLDAQRERSSRKAKKRLGRLDVESVSRHVRRAARDVLEQFLPRAGQRVYTHALLERLVRDASEQLPGGIDGERVDALHRLRIDVKQLRYALELFEPLLGEHFAALNERATQLQETLGSHRDLYASGEALAAMRADLEARGRSGLAACVGAVEASLAAERRAVFERFCRQGFDPRWWHQAFARAFGAS